MTVHLVSGPGGSGVSATAAAIAAVAAPAEVACFGDDGSLGVHLQRTGVATSPRDLAAPGPWGPADATLAAALERHGADPDVAEEWRRLPGADVVRALIRLGGYLEDSSTVVVDLGDLRRATTLASAAVRLTWSLRRVQGLQAIGSRLLGPGAGRLLPRSLDALEAAAEVLTGSATRLHLVAGRDAMAHAKVRRWVPGLVLAGIRPGAVLLGDEPARVGEEPTQGDPEARQAWAPFTVVRTHGSPPDVPALVRAARDVVATTAPTPADRESAVTRDGELLTWRLPLPWVGVDDVAVEQREDDLLVTVHGEEHLLAAPPAVRRGEAVQARLHEGELVISARLREGVWHGRA